MRKIIAAVDDLFFAAKIRGAAEALNLDILFPRTGDLVLAAVKEAVEADASTLVIFDLHAKRYDPFTLIAEIKSDEKTRNAEIIAFFSHVEIQLMQRAQAAGADRALPRSAFTKRLPEILRG